MTAYADDREFQEQQLREHLAANVVPLRPEGPLKTFRPEPYAEITPSLAPWRVKGVLPMRGAGFMVGQKGAAKTFVALDWALRISSGGSVLKKRTKTCGTIYLAIEDPDGCRTRVAAWRKHMNRSAVPFELVPDSINLLKPDEVDAFIEYAKEAAERMREMSVELGLIVIDTWATAIPGIDENNSQGQSEAWAALMRIADATGAFCLAVAHFGKAGAEKGIRGWSGLDSNSYATITIERDEEDPDLRHLTVAKVKNGVDGLKHDFVLNEVELGLVDDDGDKIVSCVVAYQPVSTEQKPQRAKALTAGEKVVLQAVRFVTANGTTVTPPPLPGVTGRHRAVMKPAVRERAYTSGFAADLDKANSKNVKFNRAIEGLVGKSMIRVEDEILWLTNG